MKRTLTLLSLLLALGLLAGCGAGAASSDVPAISPESAPQPETSSPQTGAESEAAEDSSGVAEAPLRGDDEEEDGPLTVYRGVVASLLEDGSIEVEQLYGYNYGYDRILFHLDDATKMEDGGFTLAEGVFVEVAFDGTMTRSDPPQASADKLTILASTGDGAIMNGMVRELAETDGGYTLTLVPFDTPVPVDLQRGSFEGENDGEADEPALEEVTLPDSDIVIVHVETGALEHLTAEDLQPGAEVSVVTYGIMAMSMPPQVSAHALLPFQP